MKVGLWVFLTMIFVSCSDNEELDEGMASTENHIINTQEFALKNSLTGKWRQINQNCDLTGRNCDPLADEVLWAFKEIDVVWGRFTHPYTIKNDTIYIAGSPYLIIGNSGDTILFHEVNTNNLMQLVRN